MPHEPWSQDKMRRSVIINDNGCWLWQQSVNALGYGTAGHNNRSILAHRLAYQLYKVDLSEDVYLHHRCGEVRCCNPDHLQPMSPGNHVRLHKRPERCKHGHLLVGENLIVKRDGTRRICRVCKNDLERRYYHKKALDGHEVHADLKP